MMIPHTRFAGSEAEDGEHDGLLYYAIGINSIGCAAQYGAVSSLLDRPLCIDY